MELLKTESAVWHYLLDKRNEIIYRAQEAKDLHNIKGAESMQQAANAINVCMKSLKH
jgi:hypothetical protein